MGEDSIIVFLDNDSKRAAIAHRRMSDKDQNRTFWVSTVLEALDMLETYRERLDIVSLEHDLMEEGFTHPASEESGTEIVRWLEKKDPADYAHVRFIIHSWNATAGIRMVTRMREAGYRVCYAPFGSELKHG